MTSSMGDAKSSIQSWVEFLVNYVKIINGDYKRMISRNRCRHISAICNSFAKHSNCVAHDLASLARVSDISETWMGSMVCMQMTWLSNPVFICKHRFCRKKYWQELTTINVPYLLVKYSKEYVEI